MSVFSGAIWIWAKIGEDPYCSPANENTMCVLNAKSRRSNSFENHQKPSKISIYQHLWLPSSRWQHDHFNGVFLDHPSFTILPLLFVAATHGRAKGEPWAVQSRPSRLRTGSAAICGAGDGLTRDSGWIWLNYIINLVGGLEHFLFSDILGIIIPTD